MFTVGTGLSSFIPSKAVFWALRLHSQVLLATVAVIRQRGRAEVF